MCQCFRCQVSGQSNIFPQGRHFIVICIMREKVSKESWIVHQLFEPVEIKINITTRWWWLWWRQWNLLLRAESDLSKEMPGKVRVKVVAGRNLPVMDRSSDTTDAFAEVKLGDTTYKTDVYRKSLNPAWNSDWFKWVRILLLTRPWFRGCRHTTHPPTHLMFKRSSTNP